MTAPGGIELAQVWVPLMPEASRLAQGVNKIAGDAEKRFGRSGKVLGGHLAKGLEQGSRQAVASMKDVERATDQLSKARQKDEDGAGRVRVAQARLDDVLAKGKTTAAQRASAEEALARAQRQRENTTEQLTRAEKNLTKAKADNTAGALKTKMPLGHQMADSGSSAGGEFLASFADGIKGMGGKGGPIALAIAAAGGVAIAGGAFLGRQLWAGMQAEQRRDVIAAQIGVDEATMARYGQVAARAYTANFGESVEGNLDSIGAAIQAGIIPKGAGSGDIERTLANLETAKTVLGEDIPQVSRALGQMMKTGLVDSVEQATDVLIAGQQQGANLGGDWLDTLNEYSTQFRKLGLDAGTATVLIGQMVSNGARDSDVAADAIKEFSIRAVDGSKTTTDAFNALGLNADTMAHAFAEGGPAASKGLTEVIAAIQRIPDPVEKSRIQVALFGTQAEDLGGALNSMDLSKVAAGMESVSGATKRASDTMADNAASSVESARRNIEVSAQNVQTALAKAFGPQLEKMGGWFRDHQGDIVRFFSQVGSAALKGLDGFGAFASGTLRFLATVGTASRAVVPAVLGPISAMVKGLGGALSHLPGKAGEMGRALQTAGRGIDWYSDQVKQSGDRLNAMADGVDKLRSGLPGAADELTRLGNETADVTDLMTALGDAVIEMPDGKTITLKDNTPEVQERLKALGIKVQELPDGTVTITADTDEGRRIIDSWRRQETGKPVNVPVGADTAPAKRVLDEFMAQVAGRPPVNMPVHVDPNAGPAGLLLPPGSGAQPRARGGIDVWGPLSSYADGKLPRTALIQHPVGSRGLVQWAEPSTGGEAFIPLAPGNRRRSTAIWLETGRRLGALRFEQGGIRSGGADGLEQAVSDMVGTTYVRGGHSPQGADCSGAMSYLVNAALGMPQDSRMATGNAAEWLAARGFVKGEGGPGTLRIGWKNGGPGGGHMAGTLPDGRNVEQGGSVGEFTVGGGAAGAADPQFTNHMYLPLDALYPDGQPSGSGGRFGAMGYGSSGGGGGSGSSGGSGGGYASESERASAIADAEDRLATAEGDVREKEARLREVQADADAKESDRIAAENDLAETQRDRDKARAELIDAHNKPIGSDSGAGKGKGGPDGQSFGQDMLSGALEALGFDGEVFSDPTQWGIWKLFTGGANYVGGLLKNAHGGPSRLNPYGAAAMPYGGSPAGAQHGRGPGSPGPGNQGDGGLGGFQLGDGGGMSGVGDTLTGALPEVSDFLPSPATNAPNVDASINIHGPVGVSPNDLMSRIHSERNARARSAGSGLKGVGGF
ncbi:putative EXPORTED PROTEIN [Mycolicibacterium fortuitum]|uniref:Putative EXPORTED PROTEIN n=1 Tax=Mycolicibacterium fortuitum TaxID=1766 RepID=A0A0N9XIT8_MYCFO|nr:phage tail tape measure protein [Mycolicibacterium fortuitum]ALI26569.1 putative EXPORTED PROTEIN [Mycolicibacterium fortuitum]